MSEQNDAKGSAGSVLAAFVIGAAAGAAVALLFAPASGEETRRKISEKAREGREKAEAFAREGRMRAEALARGGREFIERQRENLDRQRENLNAAVERGKEAYDQARQGSV